MAAAQGHPVAREFEKAVADKMEAMPGGRTTSRGPKQGANSMFHGSANAADSLKGKKSIPRRYVLHPKNTTRVSPKRGMSAKGPMA